MDNTAEGRFYIQNQNLNKQDSEYEKVNK